MPEMRSLIKDVLHIAILLALLVVLLYVLTWTNTIKCKSVPGWCDYFYAIKGKPNIAIVSGTEGLGDPDLLEAQLSDPTRAGVRPTQLSLASITPGNLGRYDMVIVEKARKMSSEQIKMFLDYANTGGVLVWTGDAGSQAFEKEELLYEDEHGINPEAGHVTINAWARKFENKKVLLNERLGVDYLANYCDVKSCNTERHSCVAILEAQDRDHPLTFSIRSDLQLCVFEGQDFALVRPAPSGRATTLLSADFRARLLHGSTDYGNHLPILLTTAGSDVMGLRVGENIAYYAIPPEYLAHPGLPPEKQYGTLIENLYFGMLFG